MVPAKVNDPIVIAVLGKGGVGKTVLSALITRSILDMKAGPLLVVDADPAGGLTYALGSQPKQTMADVKENLIDNARNKKVNAATVADTIDWRVLECLREHDAYSLLAMGHTDAKGCFCPVNTLLRSAIEKLTAGFRFVLLDAEAGIEQVNRQVIRQVDLPIIVTDGSKRGLNVVFVLSELLERFGHNTAAVVLNRGKELPGDIPRNSQFWGTIPTDETVQHFDAEGRSLLDLPTDNPALMAVRQFLARHLSLDACKK